MIELKNVAVESLVVDYYSPKIQEIINEKNIISVQDLIDEMEKSPEVNWSLISDTFFRVINNVEKNNEKGREPVMFHPKKYEDNSLGYTDKLNRGDVLLLSKPTTEMNTKNNGLCRMSIGMIKRFLSMTKPDGSNYLLSYIRNIGPKAIPGILDALDMYSSQVVRQSELTDSRDINLFKYQQEEKECIVKDLYAEIIAYLICDAKELVWGKLSDSQRKAYLSSIVNNRCMDKMIKDRMIKHISNYTTMPELENVANGDYRVLKRFIKK